MNNNEKELSRTRQKRLHIRLNDEEYNALQNWQKWLGVASLNDVFRMFIHSGVGYKFENTAYQKYCAELARIGNNINQIAYRINAVNNVYESDLEMLREYLTQINENMRDFLQEKERCHKAIGSMFLDKAKGGESENGSDENNIC